METRIDLSTRSRRKVIFLFGARQSGKTTLLKHISAAEGTWFINLQDRLLRRRYESDLGLIIRELEARSDLNCLIIDEIQKVPGLLDDIQFLYDRDPDRYRFILTGSSSRQLKRGGANLLPGRSVAHILSPVLQAECRPCVLVPLPLPEEPRFRMRTLEECLLYGSLPGLFAEEAEQWVETLATYTDLYIENEIRQESIVRDMGAFNRFLELAALESGRIVNYTKMASSVGVSVNTLRNFFQVLEDTYIGMRVPPFTDTRRRVVVSSRFVFFDLGIRHSLAGLAVSPDLIRISGGDLFEQWVIAELCHRCMAAGAGYSVQSWRTAGGAEVDAVLRTPGATIPVGIKWTESPRPSDARHVETFLDLHSDARKGYVVCRTPIRQALSDRVTALPWNEF